MGRMFFFAVINGWSNTALNVKFYCNPLGGSYYGFQLSSYLTVRYMFVKNTFPDKYMSFSKYSLLYLSMGVGFPQSFPISILDKANPASITLNTTDTVFIYSYTEGMITSAKSSLDSSFELTLAFSVVNTTAFNFTISANFYPISLDDITLKVFIYNKADFDNLGVKIDYQQFSYSGLAVGISSSLTQSYTALFTPVSTNDALIGIQSFKLSGYSNVGFQLSITSSGYDFNITLQNLMVASTIPRLDILFLLIGQLKCPNSQVLMDAGKTTCYSVCPATTYQSLTALGVTGIYVCLACDSNCLNCSGTATNCTACNSPKILSALKKCILCTDYDTSCTTCNSTVCTQCASSYGLTTDRQSCKKCSDYSPQCLTCTGSVCLTCNEMTCYFLKADGSTWTQCTFYDSHCSTCNSTVCLSCIAGFYFASNGTCQSCSIYGQQCTACNQTSCTNCSQGYGVVQQKCQILNPVCGDGIWIYPQQSCNDGNIVNGDGCDSQCHVEEDYQCLIADQLPSGASFCKFTKNITIDFQSLQKQDSSNTLSIFLTLGPSTFKQWTQQSIFQLLSPIQIQGQDGNVIEISSSDKSLVSNKNEEIAQVSLVINNGQNNMEMSLTYHQNQQIGQVQFAIDYGQNNMEGCSITFNIKPNQTNFQSLQGVSAGSGVYFYGYPPETYQKQNAIRVLSTIVEILSIIFAFLGLLIPGGKLIVLEALLVIQISYFSLLSFERSPPTFVDLKYLNLSNGVNDLNINPLGSQINDIFMILGLNPLTVSNYNLTLILFVILPTIIGLIGFFTKSKGSRNRIEKEDNIESAKEIIAEKKKNSASQQTQPQIIVLKDQKPSLRDVMFQRILYENTFYGLYFGGYLALISIIHGLRQPQPQPWDYIILVVIVITWVLYGLLFIRSQSNQISLSAFSSPANKEKTNPKQNDGQQLKISTKFGQFAEVYKQLMPSVESQIMKKYYLIFLVEKIINSLLFVLLPRTFNFVNALLIGVYLIELVAMIILHKKFKSQNSSKESGSIFSYVYQNYVLRQSVNLITVIVVQTLYLAAKIILQEKGPYEAFVNNKFVTEGVPFCVVLILLSNLGFNVFCWVWELKSNKIIEKAKIMWGLLIQKEPGSSQLKKR